MEYISQTVILILAILGAFFNCVKEDINGRKVRSRLGLPVPTKAGVIILFLILISFSTSLRITYLKNVNELNSKKDLLFKLDTITKQNAELQNIIMINKEQLEVAVSSLNELKKQIQSLKENPELKLEVGRIQRELDEAEQRIKNAQFPSTPISPQTVNWITIRNKYKGSVDFYFDGKEITLQENEATSLKVKTQGSSLQLWSCGWPAKETPNGSGCKLIFYNVLPGQSWEIIMSPPAPRIVMNLTD